jgi:predicted Fe-Mo cluster-binding NifX family protein
MKIIITASEPNLSSSVDPRFGRSPYFILLDTDTMEFESIENPNISSPGGAGIQSAQLIANKGAKALLTGSCGPNAYQTLEAAGVEVFIGVSGTVKEAAQKYKNGQLQSASEPNVSAHFGMGTQSTPPSESGFNEGFGGGIGRGMGRGMGMGRGIGMGRGRGMGRGMGMGRGTGMGPGAGFGSPPPGSGWPSQSPEQELENLKQQADFLRQQLENIAKKIEELENKKS